MKKYILQLGKENAVCNSVEEAKEFISRFGHLTSAGEKRITGLFDGTIGMSRDFAWMMPKHIPELKNYPELLKNVEQPKLAKTLIKLREVYVEYLTETNRVSEDLGVILDQQGNNFVKKYNELTDIVSKTIGIIMEAEISEALKLY